MGMGHQAAISIDSNVYPFVSEGLKRQDQILERSGSRGTRSADIEDVAQGPYHVAGPIVLEPSYAMLLAMWKLAVSSDGATLTLDETLSDFTIIVDRDDNIWTYENCKINKFTVSSSQGGLVRLTLDIVGITEAMSGSPLALPNVDLPLQHADCTVNLGSDPLDDCETSDFTFTLDNALQTGRFMNALTLTEINEGPRAVAWDMNVPNNDTYESLLSSAATGIAGSLRFDDPEDTDFLTLSMSKLVLKKDTPTVANKDEIMAPLAFMAKADGATKEVVAAVA